MYKEPLLYVQRLKPQSFYVEQIEDVEQVEDVEQNEQVEAVDAVVDIEQESTSVFEVEKKPSLVLRQLQFLQGQKRYVTLVLMKGEKIFGSIMNLEKEQVWIMTDAGEICIAVNTIRAVK